VLTTGHHGFTTCVCGSKGCSLQNNKLNSRNHQTKFDTKKYFFIYQDSVTANYHENLKLSNLISQQTELRNEKKLLIICWPNSTQINLNSTWKENS